MSRYDQTGSKCGVNFRALILGLLFLCLLAGEMIFSANVKAQIGGVPTSSYFNGFNDYYAGNYSRALSRFKRSSRLAIRDVNGQWIDSICYHTMIGECHYKMGNLSAALVHYELAVNLIIVHKGWMSKVQFPALVPPTQPAIKKTIHWAQTQRNTAPGAIPKEFRVLRGNLDNRAVLEQGGVIQEPRLQMVNVQEIVRCMALAIYRRNHLLGPVCPYQKKTSRLIVALSGYNKPGHWSVAWNQVLLGIAYSGAGKKKQAEVLLTSGAAIAGRIDHILTGTALLELGKISFRKRNYEKASTFLKEATLTAAIYRQADIMEEAFRFAVISHMIINRKDVYAALAIAANWAAAQDFYHLRASLLMLAGENYASMGDSARAAKRLAQAELLVGRRKMRQGKIGARLFYLTALVKYQVGRMNAGNVALGAFLNYQKTSSLWLYHIALLDELYVGGKLTPLQANVLYKKLLRDPTLTDWSTDPMESLTVIMSWPGVAMEHWFATSLILKDDQMALAISDKIKRRYFYSTLPFGGRLLAMRWILHAPEALLDEPGRKLRQQILASFPQYTALNKQVQTLKKEIEKIPLPKDKQAVKHQKKKYKQYQKLISSQEIFLRELALQRISSWFVFPPKLRYKKIQQELKEDQMILSYLVTARKVHLFLITRGKLQHHTLVSSSAPKRHLIKLLEKLGNHSRRYLINKKILTDQSWKQKAKALFHSIASGISQDRWNGIKELIVVPDGFLWYVPFELLPLPEPAFKKKMVLALKKEIPTDQVKLKQPKNKKVKSKRATSQYKPLIGALHIRYVPTVSLAMPSQWAYKPHSKTILVPEFKQSKNKRKILEAEVKRLIAVVPNLIEIPKKLPAPSSVMSHFWDRLVVLQGDKFSASEEPYQFSPAQVDRNSRGSQLSRWMELPWGKSRQVIMPSFRTAAEVALNRKKISFRNGDEIFLTVCGLMASGSRTVLLSRWQVGGKSSLELMREYVQELPHTSAANAWQRSVELLQAQVLEYEKEPKVAKIKLKKPINYHHPYFWAGYLLIDTGGSPQPLQAKQ